MNAEKLKRLQTQVRIGGKGTPRRKKKVMHQTAASDDKKLQSSLKKLSVSTIPGIEEVNIIKDDLTVIHFNNPKAQASLSANTFAVTGHGETKKTVEMLPDILPQLGQETVVQLRMFANSMSKNLKEPVDDDDVPLLVSDFDEIAKKEDLKEQIQGRKNYIESLDKQPTGKDFRSQDKLKATTIAESLNKHLQSTENQIKAEVNATKAVEIREEHANKDQNNPKSKVADSQQSASQHTTLSMKECSIKNEKKRVTKLISTTQDNDRKENHQTKNTVIVDAVLCPTLGTTPGSVDPSNALANVEKLKENTKNIEAENTNASQEGSIKKEPIKVDKNMKTVTKYVHQQNKREKKEKTDKPPTISNTQPSENQIEAAKNEFNDHKHLIELKLTDDLLSLTSKNYERLKNCDLEMDNKAIGNELSLPPNVSLCLPSMKLHNLESKKNNTQNIMEFAKSAEEYTEPTSPLQNLVNLEKPIEIKEEQCENHQNITEIQQEDGSTSFPNSHVKIIDTEAPQSIVISSETKATLEDKKAADFVPQHTSIVSAPVDNPLQINDMKIKGNQALNLTDIEHTKNLKAKNDQAAALEFPHVSPSTIQSKDKVFEGMHRNIQTQSEHAKNSKERIKKPEEIIVSTTKTIQQEQERPTNHENISQSSIGAELHVKATVEGSAQKKGSPKKDTDKAQITSPTKSDLNVKRKQVSPPKSGTVPTPKQIIKSAQVCPSLKEKPSIASKTKQISSQVKPQATSTALKSSTPQPKKSSASSPYVDQSPKISPSTKTPSPTVTPQAASSSKPRISDSNNQKTQKKPNQSEPTILQQKLSEDAPKLKQ